MDRCHCCLNLLEDSLLKSNENNLLTSLELSSRLASCCRPVHTDDDYPKHLCNSCLHKLNSFYEFQQMYKVSLMRFHNMAKSKNSLLEVSEDEMTGYGLDQEHVESDSTIEPDPFEIREKKKKEVVKKRGRPRKQEGNINNQKKSEDERQTSPTVYEKEISLNQETENDILDFNGPDKEENAKSPDHIIHEALAVYSCNQANCNRNFSSNKALEEHQKDHGFPIIHRCEYEGCEKVFRQRSRLDTHVRNYHMKGSFANKGKLEVHMVRHASIKNFSCPYCGMKKTTKNELNVHINYHKLVSSWSCKYCHKIFKSAGNLKMHVRAVHERAKDYACKFCEKTFAKSDTRKYHEMTHTGEKPHVCDVCGKRFRQPAALRTHKNIHLRNKALSS